MPWQPQNEARDREIRRRIDAGERSDDLAAEYGLAPCSVYSVVKRLRARERIAEQSRFVLPRKVVREVRRPTVCRLSADLMAEITAARAEMATAPIYRGGW